MPYPTPEAAQDAGGHAPYRDATRFALNRGNIREALAARQARRAYGKLGGAGVKRDSRSRAGRPRFVTQFQLVRGRGLAQIEPPKAR